MVCRKAPPQKSVPYARDDITPDSTEVEESEAESLRDSVSSHSLVRNSQEVEKPSDKISSFSSSSSSSSSSISDKLSDVQSSLSSRSKRSGRQEQEADRQEDMPREPEKPHIPPEEEEEKGEEEVGGESHRSGNEETEEGKKLFAGDGAPARQVSKEEEEKWIPLSSRLDGPEGDKWVWENFSLAGLPEE
eukprot:629184-Hanusia_phi.AAC.1